MSEQLEVRYVPLGTVMLWDRNPKRHSIGDLAASIERYGFKEIPKYEPRLNNGQGGIVAGNGRIETLAALHQQGKPAPRGIVEKDGEWLVPITFGVDAASQEEAEAYGLDSNNLGLSGGDFTAYDMARLWGDGYTDVLASLALSSSLPITVDGDALDGLLRGMEAEPEAQPGDDDGPRPDTPTRVQPGDVWRVGEHLVCCLDSTEPTNLDRVLRGRRPKMVWADPPYGMKFQSGYHTATPAFERITGDDKPLVDFIPLIITIPVWYICCRWDVAPVFMSAIRDSGYSIVNWIVWHKSRGSMGDLEAAYRPTHETILYCSKDRTLFTVDGRDDDTWDIDTDAPSSYEHPTQKPVALPMRAFRNHTQPGDIIFDPFLGSGPSLKAAHRMGNRTVIGFELSPHYCDHILDWAASNGLPCERTE